MKYIVIYVVLLASVISSYKPIYAENTHHWQLVKDSNGIKVFTIEDDQTEIVKAKTITQINVPISDVQQVLDDIVHRHEWVPFLKKSSLVTTISESERLEYSLFSAPWPASDRDFLYRLMLVSDTQQQKIYAMQSVVSELKPDIENIIRADLFESIYTLSVIDERTTKVELIFHADPKGWLPNWIVNIIQRVLPYKILANLREKLEADLDQKFDVTS